MSRIPGPQMASPLRPASQGGPARWRAPRHNHGWRARGGSPCTGAASCGQGTSGRPASAGPARQGTLWCPRGAQPRRIWRTLSCEGLFAPFVPFATYTTTSGFIESIDRDPVPTRAFIHAHFDTSRQTPGFHIASYEHSRR